MDASEETTLLPPTAAAAAPRLQLLAAPGTSQQQAVGCRRVVTLLGSRDGCKLKLPHRKIAPVHTALVNNGTEVVAVDLVTPTGTLLNGLKLEHERLSNGDMLKLGLWSFLVEFQPSDPGAEGFHPFGLEPAPQVVALEHLATKRIMQPTREVCVIGRRKGCDIAISDNGVSRVHALLFKYFGFPAIFDLLSHNRTLVNDAPVSFKLLEDGDVITIGESRFRVRLFGSPASERAAKGSNGKRTQAPAPPVLPTQDLIDIKATEGSQRWRIVDNLQKATRKS